MKIGYIRISRDKQITALQEDALEKEQVKHMFTDTITGKSFDRPQFLLMLDVARLVDSIVVWRLDRLGRSLKELLSDNKNSRRYSYCRLTRGGSAKGDCLLVQLLNPRCP